MQEMTVREVNQNLSRVIAAAQRGESTVITKRGVPVAKVVPQPEDRRNDPQWRAAYERLKAGFEAKRETGFRVGVLSRDDFYDDP